MTTIGERIKEARKEKGLRPVELAKKIGVTRAAVGAWESGKTKRILGENLLKIATALDVKPDWLETGKGEKHWQEVTGYLDSYQNFRKNITREKLDGILDTVDRALNDTGKKFTEKERIDFYLDGINFALSREFPPQFVQQYMIQIIKEREEEEKK